jgi:hypothetical protein
MKVLGMVKHIIPTFLEDYGRKWLAHCTILAIHKTTIIEEILSNTYKEAYLTEQLVYQ